MQSSQNLMSLSASADMWLPMMYTQLSIQQARKQTLGLNGCTLIGWWILKTQRIKLHAFPAIADATISVTEGEQVLVSK